MTTTDTIWNERLKNVIPDNFKTNRSITYTPNQGYLDTMMNRIGLTVINGVDAPYNPFSKYTKAMVPYGDTIQSYKTAFVPAQKYDPDDDNPFVKVKNKPIQQYYTINDQMQWQESVDDNQFKMAFNSASTFGSFVEAKLDSLYKSAGLDMYTKWKQYISDNSIFGKTVNVDGGTDNADLGENLFNIFRLYANSKLRQPSKDYNVAKDIAISPNVDIIMRADDKIMVDDYLKGVYNLNKVGVNANIMLIDDFATVKDKPTGANELIAVIADDRAFGFYPTSIDSSSVFNAKSLYMNYFYTVRGTFAFDRFRNCVGVYSKA